MEGLARFIGTVGLGLALSILINSLLTYIILDVSTLYGLESIASLGFVKVFGGLILLSMVRLSASSIQKEMDSDSDFGETVVVSIVGAIVYLLIWGMAYIAHMVIT